MFKKILFIFISLISSLPSFAKEGSYKYPLFDSGFVPDDIPIFDEENQRYFMEEYEGKAILLVFWASWCAQCTSKMPRLDVLQKDFRKLDFKILPVSVDLAGIEVAKDCYKKYDLRHLPIIHDYKNALFRAMGITTLPTSIIIDQEGKLIGKFTGDVHWHNEEVREILLENIPNNPATPKNSHKDISLDQKVKVKAVEKVEQSVTPAPEPWHSYKMSSSCLTRGPSISLMAGSPIKLRMTITGSPGLRPRMTEESTSPNDTKQKE